VPGLTVTRPSLEDVYLELLAGSAQAQALAAVGGVR
jgi:hypothetical protein